MNPRPVSRGFFSLGYPVLRSMNLVSALTLAILPALSARQMDNPAQMTYDVNKIAQDHPAIRGADWRSPVALRLMNNGEYRNGSETLSVTYRERNGEVSVQPLTISWSDLSADYELCRKTYQSPVITEFAALGVACVKLATLAKMAIVEVTQRGDRADYWLPGEILLEVSGEQDCEVEKLCDVKRQQLQENPYDCPGFVSATCFNKRASHLCYYDAK